MPTPAALQRLVAAFALGSASFLVSCSSEPTALVIEVDSALPPGQIDSVNFRVVGPGLEGAGRSAQVPVAGARAKTFPLRLTLVHGGAAMGPLMPTIDGMLLGERRAHVANPPGLYFQPGRTVTHRFLLVALGSGAAPAPAEPDAGTSSIDVGTSSLPGTPVPDAGTPPMPMPPPMCPAMCNDCGEDKDCRKACKKMGCCKEKCDDDDDDDDD